MEMKCNFVKIRRINIEIVLSYKVSIIINNYRYNVKNLKLLASFILLKCK